MKKFLGKIFLFTCFSTIALFLVSMVVTIYNPAIYRYLYKYQLQKIAGADSCITLLVGDSSLGNAINSKTFSSLSASPSLNCALTGLFGYAGSYNMIKNVHNAHPELKNVIVMQTIDMQQREVSYAGYIRSISNIGDITELGISELYDCMNAYLDYMRSISISVTGPERDSILVNDYIKQKSKLELEKEVTVLDPQKINAEKNQFLLKITDYCLKHKLNLIYLHGPYYEPSVEDSEEYVAKMNATIEKTGVNLIKTVLKIPYKHLGDSKDHIGPEFKSLYTQKFYDIVADELRK